MDRRLELRMSVKVRCGEATRTIYGSPIRSNVQDMFVWSTVYIFYCMSSGVISLSDRKCLADDGRLHILAQRLMGPSSLRVLTLDGNKPLF